MYPQTHTFGLFCAVQLPLSSVHLRNIAASIFFVHTPHSMTFFFGIQWPIPLQSNRWQQQRRVQQSETKRQTVSMWHKCLIRNLKLKKNPRVPRAYGPFVLIGCLVREKKMVGWGDIFIFQVRRLVLMLRNWNVRNVWIVGRVLKWLSLLFVAMPNKKGN